MSLRHKMKIAVLDGTHDKQGMTHQLIEAFQRGISSVKPDFDLKIFDLLDSDIKFCNGCNTCTMDKALINAKCLIDDKAEEIKKEALDCDVLVVASPVYEYSVSSSMKRFLERCLTLVTFRFGPSPRAKPVKHKQGVVLCASGAPSPINHVMGMTLYPRLMLRLLCKLFRCRKVKMLFAGGMRGSEKLRAKWVQKAEKVGYKIGKKLISS